MIKVWLDKTSQPIEFKKPINAYEKGSFYCVYDAEKGARKFPIVNIFQIEEPYDFRKEGNA